MTNSLLASLLLSGFLWTGAASAQSQPVGADSASRPTATTVAAVSDITFVANPDRITSLDSLLKAHRGRVVYLDFWGTWCLPCRKEMPYSARLKQKMKGQPVDFLYVAFENGYSAKLMAKWKATVRQLNIKGRHFMMNPGFEGGLSEFLEVDSYPRYVIIDRFGEILNAYAARPSETTEVVRQLKEAIDQ
ncbi:MAG: redoxin family protein [Bacteroidetes bacterium]|nr:redoxin family protein [Fibrella sp.]